MGYYITPYEMNEWIYPRLDLSALPSLSLWYNYCIDKMLDEGSVLTSLRIFEDNPAVAGVKRGVLSVSIGIIDRCRLIKDT
jgi:hypothetical protein